MEMTRRSTPHLLINLFQGILRKWTVMLQVTFQGSSELMELVEIKDLSYSSNSPQDLTLQLAQSWCSQIFVKWNVNWNAQDLSLRMEDRLMFKRVLLNN